ncbi:avidin-related protein 3-like [Corapipo altera]|uniref:avidin-related protein 3-like n=1 Tax=Corapipo altera TaxID=415028 RepID=UPI000FD62C9C|nr:avidin-related protein 3-like [Corapipo altera]
MVQVTPFLLVLNLALGAHSFSVEKCNLTGNWTNDLGSNMTILAVDEKGNFAGLYNTSVADKPYKIQQSPLMGFQHLTNPIDEPTFGFTVNWTFSGTSPFPASLVCLQTCPALSAVMPWKLFCPSPQCPC